MQVLFEMSNQVTFRHLSRFNASLNIFSKYLLKKLIKNEIKDMLQNNNNF